MPTTNPGIKNMGLTSIIIGGIIPAICLGLCTIFMRASVGAGVTIPFYLATVGTTVAIIGWTVALSTRAIPPTLPAGLYAAGMGLCWTIAIGCMAYAMGVLKVPVSVIAPLTNCNALIAVLVGVIAFSEWRTLNVPAVGIGAMFIATGATIISVFR